MLNVDILQNGLGEPFDPAKPMFHGVDLLKPDPRLKPRDISIATPAGQESTRVAFLDVNILDSTGTEPYRGDVLVQGQRIVSVGKKLQPTELSDTRIIEGDGRTLMPGMSERPRVALSTLTRLYFCS